MAEDIENESELDLAGLKRRYLLEIDLYEREYRKWHGRGKKVVKRYLDERPDLQNTESRFNILWSNVQTLLPAVFSRLPKPEVTRRFKDKDPVGRVAAIILERVLEYEIEHYTDYQSSILNTVEDRLLPGRGVSWVRYEPHYKEINATELQLTEDVEVKKQSVEVIDYECTPADYVYWEDFGHSVARTWEEVTTVWRRVYLTRKELIERFGDQLGKEISLDQKSKLDDDVLSTPDADSMKKATIYEIWDKTESRVVWLSKSYERALDVQDDPLGLECFFPCPKPLYATITSGKLEPVPDYLMYRDQATELDKICERIDGLVQALKVAGVYDATQTGIGRLLDEGVNNTLIPVDTWAMFAERGGLKGTIDFLPLDNVVGALNALYLARDQVKNVIYEVTGISDIIRGATVAAETATAQQIKSQFASLRLKRLQDEVARFATDILRLKAEIVCKHYQPETIKLISGAEQMQEAQGLADQAIMLLRDQPLRNFRIDISSDSLLEVDENQEKQDRIEFLTAAGGFLKQAVEAGQTAPELTPLLAEMLMFGVRAFKTGRTIEGQFDQALTALTQKTQQPQQPQPNPEMMKLQSDMQYKQAMLQLEQQKHQDEMSLKQQMGQQELITERDKHQMTLASQQQMEQMRLAKGPSTTVKLDPGEAMGEALAAVVANVQQATDMQAQTLNATIGTLSEIVANMQGVIASLNLPKRIIRDQTGRAVGVETVAPTMLQ